MRIRCSLLEAKSRVVLIVVVVVLLFFVLLLLLLLLLYCIELYAWALMQCSRDLLEGVAGVEAALK